MPVYDKDPPGTSGGGVGVETDPIASAALTSYIATDSGTLFTATSILVQGTATSQTLTALRSTTCGQSATFAFDDSTQVGYNASAGATDSVVVGSNAQSTVLAVGSTVVGKGAQARGIDDIVIGHAAGNANTGSYKVVIGSGAAVTGTDGIAIGRGTSALSTAVSIGTGITGLASDCVFVGNAVVGGTGGKTVAIGANASTGSQNNATAVGQLSVATGLTSCAYGSQASATATSATALGQLAVASSATTTAVGSQANASGTNATCIGSLSVAAGQNTFAMGTQANASFARAVCLGPFSAAAAADDVVIGNSATGSNPDGYIRGNQGTGHVHFSPQVAANVSLGVSRVAFYWGNAYVDRLVSRKPINDYIGLIGTIPNAATGAGYARWTGMAPTTDVASSQGTLIFTNTTGWAVRNTSGENQLCGVWLNIDLTGIGAGQGGLLVDTNSVESAAIATDARRVDISTAAIAVHSFFCWIFVPNNDYIRAWWHTTSSGVANTLNLARFYVRQL